MERESPSKSILCASLLRLPQVHIHQTLNATSCLLPTQLPGIHRHLFGQQHFRNADLRLPVDDVVGCGRGVIGGIVGAGAEATVDPDSAEDDDLLQISAKHWATTMMAYQKRERDDELSWRYHRVASGNGGVEHVLDPIKQSGGAVSDLVEVLKGCLLRRRRGLDSHRLAECFDPVND